MTAPEAPTKPPLRLDERKAHGWEWAHYVIGKAKEAALRADWSLRRWDEFRHTARACLTPKAAPEEEDKFMLVVRERFEVTTYTKRRGDESDE